MNDVSLPPRSAALGALAALIWGLSFPVSMIALEGFSPPQLTALRFMIAAVPALLVARPPVGGAMLVAIGLTLFTGQFLLLFLALASGLPPGLASVTQQTHVLFSVSLAAFFLRDAPARRQVVGLAIAFVGLGLVALSVGRAGPIAALALGVMAAFSWAVGNLLIKQVGPVPILPLIVWLSLVPPLPALAWSYVSSDPPLHSAVAAAGWRSVAATIYLGAISTLVAYAIWGWLLGRYPTSVVAPFTLLVPCVAVLASAVIFGERFGALRAGGMALIVCGVAVVAYPRATPPFHRMNA